MSVFFFFFKQKTAYEMRISDWSSDVCSSDLLARAVEHVIDLVMGDPMRADRRAGVEHALAELHRPAFDAVRNAIRGAHPDRAVRRRLVADGFAFVDRSEERRVGTEWVSTCRSRWSPDH